MRGGLGELAQGCHFGQQFRTALTCLIGIGVINDEKRKPAVF
jgi:hypothetical protein